MRWLSFARTLLVTATLAAPVSFAATASGAFSVQISLNTSDGSGICVSTALSQQTNALVRVTCEGRHFVSIEPRPGSQFVGTHGGAWRMSFPRNTVIPAFLMGDGELQIGVGIGTITALRVLNLTERDERLELLVSF